MKPDIRAKLADLLAFAKENGLQEIVWQSNGTKISFRRGAVAAVPVPGASVPPASEPAPSTDEFVRSPVVGTFRRALTKDRPPLVLEGNHVKPGDRLGVVECMKIPNDVVSYCAGAIAAILVEDGQKVEYGQPLFAIRTSPEQGRDPSGA